MLDEIRKLQKEIYQNACDKGWHTKGKEKSDVENVALFHSEISEAFQCFEEGWKIDDIRFPTDDNKPEGFFIELIDLSIRILDFLASKNIDIDIYEHGKTMYDEVMVEYFLCNLNLQISLALEDIREGEPEYMLKFIDAFNMVMEYISAHDGDFLELMKMKMEYNKTRSYRHGGKLY